MVESSNFQERINRKLEELAALSPLAYKLYFILQGCIVHKKPTPKNHNSVLLSSAEINQASKETKALRLPFHGDPRKNWDTLTMVDCVLKNTDKNSTILDAGAETYSRVLHWLFLYGYKNLIGINVDFKEMFKRGDIKFEPGDITKTRFDNAYFDAVTCQSVIEHGVNLADYFKEMSRILKKGAPLITSTDYFETPVDTAGKEAFGAPLKIFTRKEMSSMLKMAEDFGFELRSDLDLKCSESPIVWQDCRYTFIIFTLYKK